MKLPPVSTIKWLTIIILIPLMSRCAFYNEHIKKGFPISDEDKVVVLIDKQADNTSKIIEQQATNVLQISTKKYFVGKPNHNRGYKPAQIIMDGDNIYLIDADNCIYALNKTTGKRNWKSCISDNSSHMYNKITTHKGMIFVNIGPSTIGALKQQDGALVWSAKIYGLVRGMIASDKSLLISTNDNKVYSLSYDNGKVLWNTKPILTNFKLISSPKISLNDNKLILTPTSESILVYNADNGFLLREINIKRSNLGKNITDNTISPILTKDNNIILSMYNDSTILVNNSGDKVWDLPIYTNTDVLINKNIMYMIDCDGYLYSINMADGGVIWKKKITSPKKPLIPNLSYTDEFMQPIMVNNKILITSSSGYLFFIDKNSGEDNKILRITPGAQGSPVYSAGYLYFYIPNKSLVEIVKVD